ncbi:hypothetical protein K505DRAFT_323259 [Melanomma pulvis-pyrius CBS 109.77]|uniref:Rhodanese domain-containing protein n=1 Tax=Melanomma pulvis-pyrius CBS 109.77 TaxID=1314802 RepID=A0A6A6XJU5_9PLEO|nr:hypothetical protein K505DRAFT_323259 [Melanomma pulvis-pyrius CBS 109.77]
MATPQTLLIDVRTPSEYSTGFLSSGHTEALNIEYQLIDQLPSIYAARGILVQKSDPITLYCRSGRRSNIALQILRELGYENVRDIGGLEEARAVLKREELLRLVRFKGDNSVEKGDNGVEKENEKEDEKDEGEGEKKEARKKALGMLLNGLRGLE